MSEASLIAQTGRIIGSAAARRLRTEGASPASSTAQGADTQPSSPSSVGSCATRSSGPRRQQRTDHAEVAAPKRRRSCATCSATR